jgi:hypothetical protein
MFITTAPRKIQITNAIKMFLPDKKKFHLKSMKRFKKFLCPMIELKKMINELEIEKETKAQSSRFFAQKTEQEIKTIDDKLEKLMNAYFENALSLRRIPTSQKQTC